MLKAAGIHLPSPNGLYDVANPIDAFFHVGASPIAQVRKEIINTANFKTTFEHYIRDYT